MQHVNWTKHGKPEIEQTARVRSNISTKKLQTFHHRLIHVNLYDLIKLHIFLFLEKGDLLFWLQMPGWWREPLCDCLNTSLLLVQTSAPDQVLLAKSKGNSGEEKHATIMYTWISSLKWLICNKRLIYDDLRGLEKKTNKKLLVKLYHTKFNDCQQKDYMLLWARKDLMTFHPLT